MARNNSVEIYRVGLMAGICLLHSMGFGMRQNVFAMNILSSCVVGFAFISGWFGIRFSWLKLAKLYGIGVYAAAIFGMASLTIGDASDIVSAAVMAFNKLVKGFWFLHAYAVMMIMSPMINALLEKAERRGEERRGEERRGQIYYTCRICGSQCRFFLFSFLSGYGDLAERCRK